jgi:hypothetical protein
MRISILWGVLAMVLATPALSADKEQWGFLKSDSDARLFYGVPESESITLSLICEPKRKRMFIVSAVLPHNVRAKRSGKIKLSNGSASLEYPGKTEPERGEGPATIVARVAIDPRLFDLLDKGTSLVIESLDARESVPLDGVKEPLGQMRGVCR